MRENFGTPSEGYSTAEARHEIDVIGKLPCPTKGLAYHRAASGLDEYADFPAPPGGIYSLSFVNSISPEDYKQRFYSLVHRLPSSPKVTDYVLFVPLALAKFMQRLCDAFGYKFIGLVMAVYGLSQGLGEDYMGMSIDYYLKDNMKLEPATAQAFKSITHLPWVVKPVYGLISDAFPIFGYRRGPYIIIAGILGTFAWLTLAFLKKPSLNTAAFLILVANYSIASPDVMIDAAVTERSQTASVYASDLQSLSWGSMSLGGILGCMSAGQAQAHLGSKGVFALTSIPSMITMILAAAHWLPEKIAPMHERNPCRRRRLSRGQKLLYILAAFVGACAVFCAVMVNRTKDKMMAGYITIGVAVLITIVTYIVLAKISPKIARPAVYFFLREAVQPSLGEVMFFWYTSAPGGPHFKPQFLSILDCISSVSMFIGIAIYNRYMSTWKYRNIFIATQFLMVGAGMLDYVFVRRMNLSIGLSDRAFVIGDEALIPLLRKFATIPFFVLAAKVCPEKCEATLFALLMALSNFGGDVGSYMGVFLIKDFNVSRHDYTHLPHIVLIKTLARFIPIVLIPFLIPDASPVDEILTAKEKAMDPDILSSCGSDSTDGDEPGNLDGSLVRSASVEIEMQMVANDSLQLGNKPHRRHHLREPSGVFDAEEVDINLEGDDEKHAATGGVITR